MEQQQQYSAVTAARARLEILVSQATWMHMQGGSQHFDHVDQGVRHGLFFEALCELADRPRQVVVTGEFGRAFINWWDGIDWQPDEQEIVPSSVVTLRGGLRHVSAEWWAARWSFPDEGFPGDWTFLDDSYYRGRTLERASDYITAAGGRITSVAVCYDGSREQDERVRSLYRYHKEKR